MNASPYVARDLRADRRQVVEQVVGGEARGRHRRGGLIQRGEQIGQRGVGAEGLLQLVQGRHRVASPLASPFSIMWKRAFP